MKEYIATIVGIIISVLVIAMVVYFLLRGRKKKVPKGQEANPPSQVLPQ